MSGAALGLQTWPKVGKALGRQRLDHDLAAHPSCSPSGRSASSVRLSAWPRRTRCSRSLSDPAAERRPEDARFVHWSRNPDGMRESRTSPTYSRGSAPQWNFGPFRIGQRIHAPRLACSAVLSGVSRFRRRQFPARCGCALEHAQAAPRRYAARGRRGTAPEMDPPCACHWAGPQFQPVGSARRSRGNPSKMPPNSATKLARSIARPRGIASRSVRGMGRRPSDRRSARAWRTTPPRARPCDRCAA